MSKKKISKSMLFYLIISSIIILIAVQTIIIALTFVFLHYFSVDIRSTFSTVYSVRGTSAILVGFVSVFFLCSFGFSYFIFKQQMKPINNIKNGLINLTEGKFGTKLIDNPNAPRELREMTDCFNLLSEDLEKKEIFSNNFIHNFSHEFKTPIVSIRGFAKLLRDDSTINEKDRNEYLNIIVSESQRLSKLSESILFLNKIENISILNERSNYNLAEITRECILLQENKIKEKKLALNINLKEIDILCNKQFITQAVINLIDNAVKFSAENSTIDINLIGKTLSIVNEGHIDSSYFDKIFEKFYQVNVDYGISGNGIGLSIVKRIMELHGGKVIANSTKDGKVIFSLIFS